MNSLDDLRSRIATDIADFGHHVTVVAQSCIPRFAYTIGLSDKIGSELVFAGGIVFDAEELVKIINLTAATLIKHPTRRIVNIDEIGSIFLKACDTSWSKELLLGAYTFRPAGNFSVYQILPDDEHLTVDVPDMSVAWDAEREPAWRWLKLPWDLPVPASSRAVTNLDALQGHRVTEASRWDKDEWELFSGSGPDTPRDQVRIVPIGTVLAADETLLPVLDLKVGKSLWRAGDEADWHEWD